MTVSLSALRAFEVAARRLSFKAAAEELNVSPTAISHRIRSLEAALGRDLFVRSVRRVEVTPAAAELAEALQGAFRSIDASVNRFVVSPDRRTVTVGASPIIAARWLAAGLGDFLARHPTIDLRIHHTPLPVVLQMDRYDIAIAWGDGGWPGLIAEPLMTVSLSPVCAPDGCLQSGDGFDVQALENVALLHQRDREDWRAWLRAVGADETRAARGTVFEDMNVLLQAILNGQGIGLGVFPLIEGEVASGALVRPWSDAIVPRKAYHLVHPPGALDREEVRALRDWLIDTAARPGGVT